jgi:hypothetical protein
MLREMAVKEIRAWVADCVAKDEPGSIICRRSIEAVAVRRIIEIERVGLSSDSFFHRVPFELASTLANHPELVEVLVHRVRRSKSRVFVSQYSLM